MDIENVKTYIIRSHCFAEPSYAICTVYRNERGLLRGESFLIFHGNEGGSEFFPKRISSENNAELNCPIEINEELFLSEALEQAKIEHRRKMLEAYKTSSTKGHSLWPLTQEISEIPCAELVRLSLRGLMKDQLQKIRSITRHEPFGDFLEELCSLQGLRINPISL